MGDLAGRIAGRTPVLDSQFAGQGAHRLRPIAGEKLDRQPPGLEGLDHGGRVLARRIGEGEAPRLMARPRQPQFRSAKL